MTATLTITAYAGVLDNTSGEPKEMEWGALETLLTRHRRALQKDRVHGWSPAVLKPTCACGDKKCRGPRGHRTDENVIEVSALTVDLDKKPDRSPLDQAGADAAFARLNEKGLRYIAHTTHSHTADRPALRVVIALSRAVLRSEWERFWHGAMKHLAITPGTGSEDGSADIPSRFWYAPSCTPDAEPWSKSVDGEPLDVDAIMATATPTPEPVKPSKPTTRPNGYTSSAGSLSLETLGGMVDWIATYCPGAKAYENRGRHCWDVVCPNEAQHSDSARRDSVVSYSSSDGPGYKCLHTTNCSGLHWRDFRKHHQPDWVPYDERYTALGLSLVGSRAGTPDVPEAPLDPWKAALAVALADVRNALGTSHNGARAPLFSDASDLFAREFPSTPWLVDGLITRGGVAQLGAEPKSGKTWIATEIAVAIATGTKVCGEFFAQRGAVAYFYAEDLDKQVRNRIRSLLDGRGLATLPSGMLHVCPRGSTLDVTKDDDLAWIIASARQLGPIDLLVLDPLRDIHTGKENESDDMANVMRRLKVLGIVLGCTVMFAHHAGKPNADSKDRRPGQRARGSGAIHGSTDSGIYLGLRGGDGVGLFVLGVDSEVKGARSAGHFNIELTITDDAQGEALTAKATMTRPAKEAVKPASADDDAAFAFVRDLAMRGERLSRRGLRTHDERPAGLSEKRLSGAIENLLCTKRLVLRGASVCLPEITPSTVGDS